MKAKLIILISAGFVLVTASVAVAATGHARFLTGRSTSRAALGSPSAAQANQLRTLALSIAANNGEPSPANVRVVPTTFQAALAADTGASASSNQNVFMVSMSGHFVGHSFDVPPGAATPTGSVLTFKFDPATGAVVGVSLGDITPDLSQLGQVTPLQ
jgi:hypothetical protein